jgi:CheY-like chemotaxis protein
VIVYAARAISREEESLLREYTDSIIIKGAHSEERLLDDVALFLHRQVGSMPPRQQQLLTELHTSDSVFKGKTVIVVDDDMRSAFALSRVLSEHGMLVSKAENGKKALEVLDENPACDLILMDIMMPVMDGYQAIKAIRAQERFARLPIIALTAKAMTGDRKDCLQAGANDYLTKPIDQTRLLSMMRVWLCR